MSAGARSRAADCLSIVALAGAAALFIRWWNEAAQLPKMRGFDIYQHYVPNAVYAATSLRRGGVGLFWNALTGCGQPFFGTGSMAVLYPGTLFFLWLEPGHALFAILMFNLTVAGVSAYGLGRVLGLGALGALALGVSFAFGNASIDLATWSPMVGSGYAWLPAVMLCCERIVRHPTPRGGVGLGVVLAVAVLGGFPQHVMLAYQLVALRLVWALVTRELQRRARSVGLVAFGLVLAPLLVAVVLLPSIETAMLSVRGHVLSVREMVPQGFLTMERFRTQLARRIEIFNPFRLLPWLVFAAALLRRGSRSVALFYLVAGLAYFDVAFGENGHLFALFEQLPGTSLFREPQRCLWITGLCLAVLTGFAVDAYVAPDAAPRSSARTALLMGAPLAGVVAYHFFWPNGLTVTEWWLAGGTLAAVLLSRLPAFRLVGGAMLVAALAVDLLVTRPAPFRHLLPDWTLPWAHAEVFAWLRPRATLQDRVYVVGAHTDFSLMPKTPALFGMRSVTDYEPQPSQRWAEFHVLMRSGTPMRTLNDFYFGRSRPSFARRLLDLTGARFVVSGIPPTEMVGLPSGTLVRLHVDDGVTVYENPTALPRARYVPGLSVVPDSAALLDRLASGPDDLRSSALVEAPPASGFLGDPGAPGGGVVTFVADEFEHVVLHVEAPRRGFVVLADQHFPGWHATVNGAPAAIIRANHVFRAVEVPAGGSVVDFRYAPASVRIGGWLTGLTLLGLVAAGIRARRTGEWRERR